jgi:hypothetical protein
MMKNRVTTAEKTALLRVRPDEFRPEGMLILSTPFKK